MTTDREFDDCGDVVSCNECGGQGLALGYLGDTEWFRCRACGHTFTEAQDNEATDGDAKA